MGIRFRQLASLGLLVCTLWSHAAEPPAAAVAAIKPASSSTTDHSKLEALKGPFKTGPEITKACLSCHNKAGHQVMKSVHWTWEAVNPTTGKTVGKKVTANNFCGSPISNEARCTSCHAGMAGPTKTLISPIRATWTVSPVMTKPAPTKSLAPMPATLCTLTVSLSPRKAHLARSFLKHRT